ncbi:MAG: MATE family efflux transporter [Lachnospiraceae bacterium]
MIREKAFYQQFFKIAVVLIMQNVVTLSVNLMDNIMLGGFSEAALAGAASVNQIQFVYQQVLFSFGDALVIFGSQYWGKKQTEEIKRYAGIAMSFAICIMIFIFLVASLFPTQLVMIFTSDIDIITEGVAYLSIIRFSYIFFGITVLLLAMLRSIEVVKIAFYLSLSTLLINCSINWVLIYGRFGFPCMGISGAAIGTLVARIVELIILIIYIMHKERVLHITVRDFIKVDWSISKKYLIVAAPILLGGVMWGVNTAAQTAILGHLSSNAIAANSAASNLFLLVKTAAVGAASTTAIMIGKAIGAGEIHRLKAYAKTFQLMFLMIGIMGAVVLFFLIEPVLSLYTLSEESLELARSFLYILCFTNFFMAYQMPTNIGIIRGSGNTKYFMWLDLISIYGIVLPLSFYMAFVVKASPIIVVICLNSDQVFKCIPAFIKTNFMSWGLKRL